MRDGEMLLQIHDELLCEVWAEDLPQAARELKRAMEGALQLKVPLPVQVKSGPDWGHLGPLEMVADEDV